MGVRESKFVWVREREREREFMDNSLIVNNSEKQRERDWVYR